jgi:excisionase family DNA binding protein
MNKRSTMNHSIEDLNEQLISADLLAKRLDISKRTLQRLRSKGQMPTAVYLGRSVRWRLQDVNDWIARGCPPIEDRQSCI